MTSQGRNSCSCLSVYVEMNLFFFSLVSFSGMISAFYLCQSQFTCFLSLPILFNMQILIAFLINFRIQWQLRVKARLGKHTNQSNNNSQQPKNLAWRNRHHSRKTVSSIWCSCILNQMWLFLQLKETFFSQYCTFMITVLSPWWNQIFRLCYVKVYSSGCSCCYSYVFNLMLQHL